MALAESGAGQRQELSIDGVKEASDRIRVLGAGYYLQLLTTSLPGLILAPKTGIRRASPHLLGYLVTGRGGAVEPVACGCRIPLITSHDPNVTSFRDEVPPHPDSKTVDCV